jgi:hypothetical protein
MSESIAAKTRSTPFSVSNRHDAGDLRMLVVIEKWMATIREINREQQSSSSFPSFA